MDFWISFVANITERNLFGLDLVVLLELELVSYSLSLKPFILRPGDCKYRELIFKTEITDFFIFCQVKPFGELFSKISLKLAREFLV